MSGNGRFWWPLAGAGELVRPLPVLAPQAAMPYVSTTARRKRPLALLLMRSSPLAVKRWPRTTVGTDRLRMTRVMPFSRCHTGEMQFLRTILVLFLSSQFLLAGFAHGQGLELVEEGEVHAHVAGHAESGHSHVPCEGHDPLPECGHCVHCQIGGLAPDAVPALRLLPAPLLIVSTGVPPPRPDSLLRPPRPIA